MEKDKEWTLALLKSVKDKISKLIIGIENSENSLGWEGTVFAELPFIYSDLNIVWNSDTESDFKKYRDKLIQFPKNIDL